MAILEKLFLSTVLVWVQSWEMFIFFVFISVF